MNFNLSSCVSCISLIYGIVFLTQSLKWPYWMGYGPGAAFVPIWCNSLLIVFSIWCLYRSLKEKGTKISEILPKGIGRTNLLITWGAMFLFIALVKYIGLIISSSLMLTLLFSRGYKWYKALLMGVTVTVICFYVFGVLLQVPVPVNKFGW